MVVRGERELRGERRGKDGRSLLATAVPFFFVYLLIPCTLSAQRIDIYARGGVAGSTALVTDQVATPGLAQLLGSPVDTEVRAVPAPGPVLAGGVRVAFWPSASLGLDASWSPTELRAEDNAGTRPIQDLNVIQTTVIGAWSIRPSIEIGGGAGLLWYSADEQGLFAEGSDVAPVVEVSAGWTPGLWNGRVAVVGSAQTHRFSTPVVRAAGAQDGNVVRVSVSARIRLLETGR